MPSLEHIQAALGQAIDHGPAFLPDRMFKGTRARVLAGMKVHANTISHARLVALEETFPRTRALLGHDRFNALARRYLEVPGVTARTLTDIGMAFPGYLADEVEAGAEADLAEAEWHWLKAHHAADAMPLRLADLAGLDERALLNVAIAAHPSASIWTLGPSVFAALGKDAPALSEAPALLIVRPEAEVLLLPASIAMSMIFSALEELRTIGNCLRRLCEFDDRKEVSSDDFMAALIALLDAGALVRAQQPQVT